MASGYFLPRWTQSLRNGDRETALKEDADADAAARAMGIESRWWGAPRDEDIRQQVWRIQLDAHVDWLSGDDLEVDDPRSGGILCSRACSMQFSSGGNAASDCSRSSC